MFNDFQEYYNKLQQYFGEDTEKLFLLKMGSLIYPISAHKGNMLDGPMVICVKNKQRMKALIDFLRGYGISEIKTLVSRPREIRDILDNSEYGLTMFIFANGRYTKDNLQQISARCKEINKDRSLLVFIVLSGSIPEKYAKEMAGFVYLKDDKDINASILEDDFSRPMIETLQERILPSDSGINGQDTNNYSELAFLVHAIDFFRQFLQIKGATQKQIDDLVLKLECALDEIESEWQIADDCEVFAEAFRRVLLNTAMQMTSPILNRFWVEGEDINKIETAMYYDDEAYYLLKDDFEGLCDQIKGNVSLSYVKQHLERAGVLVSEGKQRTYYSKKVEVITVFGFVTRVHRMKILRNKVDKDGEIYFLNQILNRERRSYEKSEVRSSDRDVKLLEDCRNNE